MVSSYKASSPSSLCIITITRVSSAQYLYGGSTRWLLSLSGDSCHLLSSCFSCKSCIDTHALHFPDISLATLSSVTAWAVCVVITVLCVRTTVNLTYFPRGTDAFKLSLQINGCAWHVHLNHRYIYTSKLNWIWYWNGSGCRYIKCEWSWAWCLFVFYKLTVGCDSFSVK